MSERTGIVGVLLSQWRNNVRAVPIEKCLLIEKATKGMVTRRDLRPDDWMEIWPELAEKNHVGVIKIERRHHERRKGERRDGDRRAAAGGNDVVDS